MKALVRLNDLLALCEKVIGAALGLVVVGLVLLNVVTRTWGNALFWTDEAAIAAMVWMAFLGTSLGLYHKQLVAVTLLPDLLPENMRRGFEIATDTLVLIFALTLLALAWKWFDPVTLALSGFDTKAFSQKTFNFIYAETTTTLGVQKFWLWLVMLVFSFNLTIHALTNLLAHRTAASGPRAVQSAA